MVASKPEGQQRPKAERSMGVDPDSTSAFAARLRQEWDADTVVNALQRRVEEYAARHGGVDALLGRTHHGPEQELEILQKVVDDGERVRELQPAERPVIDLLATGMREWVDYSLDEVDRARVNSVGAVVNAFSWKSQGSFLDIPALRRSQGENFVGAMGGANGQRSAPAQDRALNWRLRSRELRGLRDLSLPEEQVEAEKAAAVEQSWGRGRFSVV